MKRKVSAIWGRSCADFRRRTCVYSGDILSLWEAAGATIIGERAASYSYCGKRRRRSRLWGYAHCRRKHESSGSTCAGKTIPARRLPIMRRYSQRKIFAAFRREQHPNQRRRIISRLRWFYKDTTKSWRQSLPPAKALQHYKYISYLHDSQWLLGQMGPFRSDA